MAASVRVAEYRRLNQDLVTLAQRDFAGFFGSLDTSDVAKARDAITVYATALVETYGRPAALIAAQFYDDLRVASPNATGTFRAILADPVPAVEIAATARWAVAPLVGDSPNEAAALERMSGAVQRYVSQAGRDTIALNVERENG